MSGKLVRYGLAAVGPIGTAGGQFALTLVLLHSLAPAAFGRFSFLLVTSQFCMGIWSALLCAPLPLLLSNGAEALIDSTRRGLMATNLALSALAFGAFVLAGSLLGAGQAESLLFAAYATVMLLRWFARSYAYATLKPFRTMASDVLYSLVLLGAVGVISVVKPSSLTIPYAGLALSALLSLLPFGPAYLKAQFLEIAPRDLLAYLKVWRDHSRWSLVGVLTTEATVNAHVYIVTALSGPSAFAPLAASALLMRPLQVATNALTEFERPQMARQIAQGRTEAALKAAEFFRLILMLCWLGTLVLGYLLYRFAPEVLFPPDYMRSYLMWGAALWLAVAVVRLLRSPESALLQAAGEFGPLAKASIMSCFASLIAVGVLVALVGPLWSILGVLAGEIVCAGWTWRERMRWRERSRIRALAQAAGHG